MRNELRINGNGNGSELWVKGPERTDDKNALSPIIPHRKYWREMFKYGDEVFRMKTVKNDF